jgi:signal transduction histidine kinase
MSKYAKEGSRNRESGGIGLGLAIALSVVQAHGGQLTLSNRPKGGLHAAITLPT